AMYALYKHFGLDPAIQATAGDKQPTDWLDGDLSTAPDRSIILGRDHPGTVDAKDNLISREQAQLTLGEDDRLYIKDLNSTNGTFVNGEKIPPGQPVPIGAQDKVTLGSANGTPLRLSYSDIASFQPTTIGTIKSVNDPEIDLHSLPLQPPYSKDLITVTENIPKGIDLDVPPYAAPSDNRGTGKSSDTSGIPPSVATDSGLGGVIDIAPAIVAAAI
ncbi:MAG TPA: FHA domain-containing protein, partial [Chroococcales cyanobacterium]